MDGSRARAVLGVSEHATADDVRRAFRQRCFVTHPDHGGDARAFAETLHAFRALEHAPAPTARVARARRRFDSYDSPARPAPTRTFADILHAATARLTSV
jgi:curved DNA-binding protein CbpA